MIKIGTRGSKLALWQANFFQNILNEQNIPSEIITIKTKGDIIQNLSFDKIEGKGFFTKEIETALHEKTIDVAVHSLKDLPTESPENLVIAGLSNRANPADALLIQPQAFDPRLPFRIKKGGTVGTSSQRRKALLHHFRPDLQLIDIRGNVPTRINKLREGNFDAIVLAQAGIDRIQADCHNLEVITLNPKEFISAPGQGVVAFQTRKEDTDLRKTLNRLTNRDLVETTNIERGILRQLEGGCHLPIGAYCTKDPLDNYHVWACYGSDWTEPLAIVQHSSNTQFELIETVVDKLKNEMKK